MVINLLRDVTDISCGGTTIVHSFVGRMESNPYLEGSGPKKANPQYIFRRESSSH